MQNEKQAKNRRIICLDLILIENLYTFYIFTMNDKEDKPISDKQINFLNDIIERLKKKRWNEISYDNVVWLTSNINTLDVNVEHKYTEIQYKTLDYYEGYAMTDVVLPIRLMRMMGAEKLLLTNASGGVNPNFNAGDFMLMTDHISTFAPNPLIGANIEELGTRFPDMTEIYDKELRDIIIETAKENDIELRQGIYAQLTGPSFESPAEIRMFHNLGIDAVGMSTVVEAIAANHMGMKICCISFISNPAAGMNENPLTHEEVQEAADAAAPRFKKLVTEVVKKFGEKCI